MAERLGEALLDLDTDDRKFNQGVDRAGRKAEGLGRTFDDVSRRAARVGKVMAAAAAVGATAFGAGIVGAIRRLEEMRKASAQVDRALKNSGNTARTSAQEIEAWADALEHRTGRAAEEVMAVSANLASFGFGRAEFFRAIELADDMSAAWGGDLRQNLEGLSRALDDPLNGMAMLSKRGIKLTDEQKTMAAAFLDANNKIAAQGVVFDALEAQVKGVAQAGFGGLSAALARVQNTWEGVFEDLVRGTGQTGDLRDTLIELAETVSSPDFIRSVTGFGTILVQGMTAVAEAVVWAWGKMKDFLAWLDGQNPTNMSGDTLAKRIADQEAAIKTAEDKLYRSGFWDDKGGWFGSSMGAADGIANMKAELGRLQAELAKRNDPSQFNVGGTFDQLKGGSTFGSPDAMWRFLSPGTMGGQSEFDPYGGVDTSTDATDKQRDAVRALIADLEHERDIVGLSAREQQILNTIRNAGVDATSKQADKIRELITETEEHRAAIEAQQEAYAFLGDIALDSIEGLIDGSKSLSDVLGDVAKMLQRALLQAALLGEGPLAGLFGSAGTDGNLGGILGSIFSGFHAKGGLIPSGTFGIVGERGPEPVIGTSRGAMVLPNSALAGMGGAKTEINVYNNAGVDVETQSSDDGQGGVRQDIILNRAVANAIARPGPANRAVRMAGRVIRR